MSENKKQEKPAPKKRKQLSDDQAMDIARKVMREDKEVLKKLAE
jgi:hypothetical protein